MGITHHDRIQLKAESQVNLEDNDVPTVATVNTLIGGGGGGSSNALSIRGVDVSATAPTSQQGLVFNGSEYVPADMPAPVVLQHTVTLTDVQIKALEPIIVLPAAGTDKILAFMGAIAVLDLKQNYTGVAESSVVFGIGYATAPETEGSPWEIEDASNFCNLGQVISFSTPPVTQVIMLAPVSYPNATSGENEAQFVPSTNCVNRPLALKIDNGNDETPFTGGDPANTLKVTVFYSIVDL